VAPLLARDHRVLAPDLRGDGATGKPKAGCDLDTLAADILGFADATARIDGAPEATPTHLVGHDWGAAVGWWAVITAPQRFASFTAISVAHPRAFHRVPRAQRRAAQEEPLHAPPDSTWETRPPIRYYKQKFRRGDENEYDSGYPWWCSLLLRATMDDLAPEDRRATFAALGSYVELLEHLESGTDADDRLLLTYPDPVARLSALFAAVTPEQRNDLDWRLPNLAREVVQFRRPEGPDRRYAGLAARLLVLAIEIAPHRTGHETFHHAAISGPSAGIVRSASGCSAAIRCAGRRSGSSRRASADCS